MKKVLVVLVALLALALAAAVGAGFASTGYSDADLQTARDQGYESGYSDGYEDGLTAPRPIAKPESGTILFGREYYTSEITVTADSHNDYVVTLQDILGKQWVSFYVNAGDTVTVGVPGRGLYAYFASGTEWYGYGKGLMFGADTTYTKDDTKLDFSNYTYTYTLYPVTNGNFHELPSSEDEFF